MHSVSAKCVSHFSILVTVQFMEENRVFLCPWGNLEVRFGIQSEFTWWCLRKRKLSLVGRNCDLPAVGVLRLFVSLMELEASYHLWKPSIVWLQLYWFKKKSLRWFRLWPSGIFSQLSSSKNCFIASFCFWEANGFSPPGTTTVTKWI